MLGGQYGYVDGSGARAAGVTHGSGGSGGERGVRVLGDVLVGLLGSSGSGLLNGLRDGVDGVLNAVGRGWVREGVSGCCCVWRTGLIVGRGRR